MGIAVTRSISHSSHSLNQNHHVWTRCGNSWPNYKKTMCETHASSSAKSSQVNGAPSSHRLSGEMSSLIPSLTLTGYSTSTLPQMVHQNGPSGALDNSKLSPITLQGCVLPNLVVVARQGVLFCPYVSCLLCASPALLSPRALRPTCPISPTPCSPLANSGVRTASASLLSGLAFSHPSCSASNFPFGFGVNSLSLLALNSPSTSVPLSLSSVYAFQMRVRMRYG
jgi:hypothetical protein